MDYIITYFTSILEHTSLMFLGLAFGESKFTKKQLTFFVMLFSCFKTITYLSIMFPLALPKAIFVIVSDTLFLNIVLKAKKFNNIFTAIIDYIINLSSDYLILFLISGFTSITTPQLINNINAFIITTFTAKFLVILITFIFSKLYRQFNHSLTNIGILEWILMLIFPTVSLITLIVIIYASVIDNNLGAVPIIVTVGILAANIATLYIISKLSADKQIKQDNALLNQQIKMGMENIAALNSAYAQQRKLTHDFNNHLSVIRSLLESGDTAQAKEYTGSLLASSISVTRLFDSGNTIVDTLLTQKYNHAKELGIKMQVLVEDLSQVAMSSENLVVVLSNLLDNAIEACMNTSGEKMIKVKFVLEDMGHILTVQNTAPNTPQAENRQFTTTKADRLNHGYGIKNISSVLDSYGYPHSFNYENGIFTFTAIMVG